MNDGGTAVAARCSVAPRGGGRRRRAVLSSVLGEE